METGTCVYSASAYYMEMSTARMLVDLNITGEIDAAVIEKKIASIEKETGTVLDGMQKKAVIEAVRCGLLVITGGPGTGKTTTINTLISYFESEGLQILLAAPTGRAAKRMTEATGFEAKTVHRLLEISGVQEDGGTCGRIWQKCSESAGCGCHHHRRDVDGGHLPYACAFGCA